VIQIGYLNAGRGNKIVLFLCIVDPNLFFFIDSDPAPTFLGVLDQDPT
jgi:hypothetical protein